MTFSSKAIRKLLQRPSREMFNLAVQIVTKRRRPDNLSELEPMKLLVSVAYVLFLRNIMRTGAKVASMETGTLRRYHDAAWHEATALLTELGVQIPAGIRLS
jgi:hypothetical protein